jgi:predicted aldo/keto reductase-like oxidoreductase
LDVEQLGMAVRYSLGIPGVATLNLGVHNREQLRKNVQMVKRYQPLTDDDQEHLRTLGKQLAQQWGPHFGPVA